MRIATAVLRKYASCPAELRDVVKGMVEERQVTEIVRRHQGGESQRARPNLMELTPGERGQDACGAALFGAPPRG